MDLIPNVNLPEGQSGNWKVEKFTISKREATLYNVNAHGRPVREGTYTRLVRNGKVVMSDTPAEKRDHFEPVYRAYGRCLVNGLGLGMIVSAMLEKKKHRYLPGDHVPPGKFDDKALIPTVEHVTVIEKDADVIALVGLPLKERYGDRLTIIHADAFEYTPSKGERYDFVWHDIWDNICSDNLSEMHKLHRKYGRYCKWQGSWGRDTCEYYRRSNSGY
ncbi:MAG: hypothetical protein JXN60_06145 [Lentisphaerae bacterium]|nr:hypothetical protein [Lentisphaerota bacterium]